MPRNRTAPLLTKTGMVQSQSVWLINTAVVCSSGDWWWPMTHCWQRAASYTTLQYIGWRGDGMESNSWPDKRCGWLIMRAAAAVTGLEHSHLVGWSARTTPALTHCGVMLWYYWARPPGWHAIQTAWTVVSAWQMAECNDNQWFYSDKWTKDNSNLKNWSQGEKFAAIWSADLWNYVPNSARKWPTITCKDSGFCTCDVNIANWSQISNLSNKSSTQHMQTVKCINTWNKNCQTTHPW